MFNAFLEDLKEQLRNKASFWARIKEGKVGGHIYFLPMVICKSRCIFTLSTFLEQVTLINKNECGDVNITEEAAKLVIFLFNFKLTIVLLEQR